MRTDVLAELKGLRLHGMAQAWVELEAQGDGVGMQASRWLVEHLLQPRLVRSWVSKQRKASAKQHL